MTGLIIDPKVGKRAESSAPTIEVAIEITRGLVAGASTPRERLQALWAGAKNASEFAHEDVIRKRFIALGEELGRKLGRYAAEDSRHVVDWACRGLDPWGRR